MGQQASSKLVCGGALVFSPWRSAGPVRPGAQPLLRRPLRHEAQRAGPLHLRVRQGASFSGCTLVALAWWGPLGRRWSSALARPPLPRSESTPSKPTRAHSKPTPVCHLQIWGCDQERSHHIVHEFFKSPHFINGIPVIPGTRPLLSRVEQRGRGRCLMTGGVHERHWAGAQPGCLRLGREDAEPWSTRKQRRPTERNPAAAERWRSTALSARA